jgi:predicted DNA-binding protein (MmcQ/YjbR family)
MNKDHWVTILLDGSAEDALIRELLEISFDLTNWKKKPKKDA